MSNLVAEKEISSKLDVIPFHIFIQFPIFLTRNTSYPVRLFDNRTFMDLTSNSDSVGGRGKQEQYLSSFPHPSNRESIELEEGGEEIDENYVSSQDENDFKLNQVNYHLKQSVINFPYDNSSSNESSSSLLFLLNETVQNTSYSDASVNGSNTSSSFLHLTPHTSFPLSQVAQSYLGQNGSTGILNQNENPELMDGSNLNWFILLLGILVLVGVLGNLLVCLAICYERRLQNATNFFLLSLAIADLLVSIIVMPISILYEFYGFWPFGYTTCNFWVTFDVLCCSSSIYHMVFISVGRYIGIKNPLHARQTLMVSRRAVAYKIALAWLSSALISCPITILALIDSYNIQVNSTSCYISNNYFLFFGSFAAFYLPMFVMINCFVLTVRLLNQKAKFCRKSSSSNTEPRKGERGSKGIGGEEHSREELDDQSTGTECPSQGGGTTVRSGSSPRNTQSSKGGTTASLNGRQLNTEPLMTRTFGSSLQVRTEQKASKVLGLVFFVFAVCWTPFFTLNLIIAIFPKLQVPSYLSTTFLWLGYSSSTMNPIIYTIFNRNFRTAFMKVLRCAYSCSGGTDSTGIHPRVGTSTLV